MDPFQLDRNTVLKCKCIHIFRCFFNKEHTKNTKYHKTVYFQNQPTLNLLYKSVSMANNFSFSIKIFHIIKFTRSKNRVKAIYWEWMKVQKRFNSIQN